MSEWILAGVKNILVAIIEPKSEFFHAKLSYLNKCGTLYTASYHDWIKTDRFLGGDKPATPKLVHNSRST
ncbi:MAG: hypothetical protein ACJAZ0_001690 [Halioglobus sp.]|jgi:hypothetical protein